MPKIALLLLFIGQTCLAADVALSIYVVDDRSFHHSIVDEVEYNWQSYLPDRKHVNIQVDSKDKSSAEIREAIREQLTTDLAPNDQVVALLIGSHGYYSEKFSCSGLTHLGSFASAGVEENLHYILSPLRDRISKSAVVALDSCDVFKGDVNQSAARARGLLNYLGARDGMVIGAKASIFSWEILGPYYRLWQDPNLFNLRVGVTRELKMWRDRRKEKIASRALGFSLKNGEVDRVIEIPRVHYVWQFLVNGLSDCERSLVER